MIGAEGDRIASGMTRPARRFESDHFLERQRVR